MQYFINPAMPQLVFMFFFKWQEIGERKKNTSWIAYSQALAQFGHCQVTGQLSNGEKNRLVVYTESQKIKFKIFQRYSFTSVKVPVGSASIRT